MVEEVLPSSHPSTVTKPLAVVRARGIANYHSAGSCRLDLEVVSTMVALLRAYGIASLRIANASLMPPITSGNTNEPINTIGKKAAAIVVEEAA